MPVDISQNALDNLEVDLNNELPRLSINKKQGDYFEVLESLKENQHPKVILFLGSNIGNMSDEIATDFISKLSDNLQKEINYFRVDLIKPSSIVPYGDSQGITADFNLNLLDRINKELEANFDLEFFEHQPEYKESEGIAKSYLVSTKAQQVYIAQLDKTFFLMKGKRY
jgi:uncharacterized SAM-dependent methyltransferase